jgi:diguanylate cyclase (GGDEF)-like protein
MNRNLTHQQTSLATDQKGTYSFGWRSGTVVSSTANPGNRQPLGDVVEPRHLTCPTAHRLDSELWRLVLTDKLTGLCNQHGFIALAEQQWRVSRRTEQELVFVGLELEGLEEVRESSPHGQADLALMAAGKILMKTFRRSDVLCRWGGDEFRVLAVNGEGLEELMLRSRIQYQVARAGAQAAGYPLIFKGRLLRMKPQAADTFADLLALLEQDFAESKRIWCGTAGARPMLVARAASQP